MEEDCIKILKGHKLKKTPFRIKVLGLFVNNPELALSNSYLEKNLIDFDRITLYRTLKSFEESGIVHQVIDGSNASKYALCSHDCTVHDHNDDHAHFLCDDCGNTTCLEDVIPTKLSLPANYKINKVHLALSGTCSNCL